MKILIVQDNAALGAIWANHLERMGINVDLLVSADDAIQAVLVQPYDAIVIDLVLDTGSALSVADVAQVHQPAANVVFVTDTSFFSDGSIFAHAANARAMLETATPPQDLAAIVHHFAQDANRARVAQQSLAAG